MSAIGKVRPTWLTPHIATRRSAGFTLLEMLVTLAIMALLAGIGFPALQYQLARQSLAEARLAVAMATAQARADAIARDIPTRLTLSEDRATLISSTGRPGVALPGGTTLDWPRGGLIFFGDGSATAGAGAIMVGPTTGLRFAIEPDHARIDFFS